MNMELISQIEYAQCGAKELESLALVIEDSLQNGQNYLKKIEGAISILSRLAEEHRRNLDNMVKITNCYK